MNMLPIILQYYHQNQDGVSNDVGNHKMRQNTTYNGAASRFNITFNACL